MAFGIGSKLKKGLGSIANKVADKLIPKELAPFLPMLAPLFMGPGAGLMSRYLVPQLLTALSTGKTTGGISGTSQALTGLGSFLSDPKRFALDQKNIDAIEGIEEVKGLPDTMIPGSEQVGFGQLDPATGEFVFPEGGDLLMGADGTPMTVGNLPKSTYVDGTPMNVVDAGTSNLVAVPGSGTSTVGYGTGQVDPRLASNVVTTPGVASVPAGVENIYDISQIDNPTLMQRLKFGANEARDFIQGTNVANKRPFGEEVTVEEGSKLIGEGKFDPYTQSYADFKDEPLTKYKIGDTINVQDAGFGYNMPRRAVQQGIMSAGPGMAVANKMKADADAEAAAQQASFDNYYDSRQALFDYFGNAKPNYGMLYGGFANGGRIGMNTGGDISYELLQKLLKEIEDDFSNMGPSLIEPSSSGNPLIDAGFKVVRANGGRINKNDGGIASLPAGMPNNMQVDGRNGTFIPMGVKEKADDVPAMLSKNEFVMTADAVRAAGGGSVEKGAQRMYDLMNSLEARA